MICVLALPETASTKIFITCTLFSRVGHLLISLKHCLKIHVDIASHSSLESFDRTGLTLVMDLPLQ